MARPRCESYHYHRTFPEKYQAAAEYAVAHWQAFSGTPLSITPGDPDDEDCSFRDIPTGSKEYRKIRDNAGNDFLAAHLDRSGAIVLASDSWTCTTPECAQGILMHEIGHEFFLMHLKDPKAIMNANAGNFPDYNESDRQECIRVGSCKQESIEEFQAGGR